jgi:hypothetical protein
MERYNEKLSNFVFGNVHVEQQMITGELLKFQIGLLKHNPENPLLLSEKQLEKIEKDLIFNFHHQTPFLYGKKIDKI